MKVNVSSISWTRLPAYITNFLKWSLSKFKCFWGRLIGHRGLFQTLWHWDCLWVPAGWFPVACLLTFPSLLYSQWTFDVSLRWVHICHRQHIPKQGILTLSSLICSLPPHHSPSTHTLLLSLLCKRGLGHVTTHAVSQTIPLGSITGPSLSLTCVAHSLRAPTPAVPRSQIFLKSGPSFSSCYIDWTIWESLHILYKALAYFSGLLF